MTEERNVNAGRARRAPSEDESTTGDEDRIAKWLAGPKGRAVLKALRKALDDDEGEESADEEQDDEGESTDRDGIDPEAIEGISFDDLIAEAYERAEGGDFDAVDRDEQVKARDEDDDDDKEESPRRAAGVRRAAPMQRARANDKASSGLALAVRKIGKGARARR